MGNSKQCILASSHGKALLDLAPYSVKLLMIFARGTKTNEREAFLYASVRKRPESPGAPLFQGERVQALFLKENG